MVLLVSERPPIDPVELSTSGPPVSRRADRRHAQRSRRARLLFTLGGVVVLLVLLFIGWYELQSNALGPAGKRVIITVSDGETFDQVASQLAADKVIGSTFALKISDLIHSTPSVDPGSYELHENLTFAQVRSILGAPPNIDAVDIEPGQTLSEVANTVDQFPGHEHDQFAQVAASGVVHSTFSPSGSNDLEGLLGTGLYLALPGESDATLLQAMVTRFEQQAATAGLNATSANALGYSPYQLIIAASIVEKEGYYPKNMPDVARVIYNRLANAMPLQMNATVLYSLGQDGGPFTSQDLTLPTPYNSYLNKGLTPTPICSPSIVAMKAASHPPVGGWLYFVLVNKDGTEAFADTFAEQLANEKLAQQRGVG